MKPIEPEETADFRLGEWRVRPRLNRLQGDGGEVQLEPRVMSVLVELRRRAGEVVTRSHFQASVWHDSVVSDEALTRAIFELRRVLGDEASAPRYIETVRKVGYRLVAQIGDPEADAPRAAGGSRRPWVVAGLGVVGGLALLVGGLPRWEKAASDPRPRPRVTRLLTSYEGFETHPALSPDGRLLAFAWNGEGGPGNSEIYLRAFDAELPRRLTRDPARDEAPAFSPDGRLLAFVRRSDGECELLVAEVESSRTRRLGRCREAEVSRPAFTPDGTSLLYADRAAERQPFRILALRLADGDLRPLTDPPAGSFGDLHPAPSPDGQALAVVRAQAATSVSTYLSPAIGDILLFDLESGPRLGAAPPRRLTSDNEEIPGLAWSPDGRELVFASTRAGLGYALWAVLVGGGEPLLVAEDDGLIRHPAFVPDGGIAYERWRGSLDIWRAEADGEDEAQTGKPWLSSTRFDFNPDLDPEGRRLVFTSSRTGNAEIWISAADGSNPRRLTRFERWPAAGPRFSPDGSEVVLELRAAGRGELWRVGADGGDAWRWSASGIEERSPSWSLDGEWIYFASDRSGSWQIWRRRPSGEELQAVTRDGGYFAQEAGHTEPPTLLFSRRDRPGIFALEADGDARIVVAGLPREHWGNWRVLGQVLVWVEIEGRTTQILARDLISGRDRLLTRISGLIAQESPNLALGPDLETVFFARFRSLDADVILLEATSG